MTISVDELDGLDVHSAHLDPPGVGPGATIERAPMMEPKHHTTAEQEAQLLDRYGIAVESTTRPPVAGEAGPGEAGPGSTLRASWEVHEHSSGGRPALVPAGQCHQAAPARAALAAMASRT